MQPSFLLLSSVGTVTPLESFQSGKRGEEDFWVMVGCYGSTVA